MRNKRSRLGLGLLLTRNELVEHKCQKKTIWKAVRTWAVNMVDKRACRSLRLDQRRSKELCSTNGDKSSQRTKVVLNNLAERIAAAIRLEISGHDRPTAAVGLAGIVQDEFNSTLHDLRFMRTALYNGNGMAVDDTKVFATVEAAEIWFEENDPRGRASN